MKKLNFQKISGSYSICKNVSDLDIITLFKLESVFALIRDDIETTLIIEKNSLFQDLPDSFVRDDDWAIFRIKGEFFFGETGVILSAIWPLSENNIGVFILSTYSSDLLMIKQADLEKALMHLKSFGHNITIAGGSIS